jgi:hypothetical protein
MDGYKCRYLWRCQSSGAEVGCFNYEAVVTKYNIHALRPRFIMDFSAHELYSFIIISILKLRNYISTMSSFITIGTHSQVILKQNNIKISPISRWYCIRFILFATFFTNFFKNFTLVPCSMRVYCLVSSMFILY